MKYNLAGWDKNSRKIPYQTLHRFNKYGDELSIGQTWFNNLTTARRALGGVGIQTSALAANGYTGSNSTATEEFISGSITKTISTS